MIVGGKRLICALVISELISSHSSGIANSSAIGASTRCHGLNGSRDSRGGGAAALTPTRSRRRRYSAARTPTTSSAAASA